MAKLENRGCYVVVGIAIIIIAVPLYCTRTTYLLNWADELVIEAQTDASNPVPAKRLQQIALAFRITLRVDDEQAILIKFLQEAYPLGSPVVAKAFPSTGYHPDYPQVCFDLGNNYRAMGWASNARGYFETIVDFFPNSEIAIKAENQLQGMH